MIELLKHIFRHSTAGPALVRFYITPRVKLHYIHTSDAEFHTHPWNGISIIFGNYVESVQGDGVRLRRGFNRIYAFRGHKVLVDKPVWTLFIHGPRINEKWSYGGATKPWEGSDQEREET